MVKRRDALKVLKKNGWWLNRHETNHDVYTNGYQSEPIPRHGDLNKLHGKRLWNEIILKDKIKGLPFIRVPS